MSDRIPDTHRRRHVMLEERRHIARSGRQRDPELHPVQRRRGSRRNLRVADPVTRRHQVELARSNHRVASHTVAVLDLAGEKPAHRLESGVRMRWHVHPTRHRHILRTVVVDETPSADQGPFALRQGAAHVHRARAAQRHLPGEKHLDRARVGDVDRPAHDDLCGIPFQVAHASIIRSQRTHGAAS